MGRKILSLLSLTLLILTASAAFAGEKASKRQAAPSAEVLDYGAYEALLERYVDPQGQVAYEKWQAAKDDRAALNAFVGRIAKASVDGKSKEAKLAFYLNAYNALVLHAVVERWPVESVMKVDGFFSKQKFTVAGAEMTLDDLEHNKVLRVQFSEPRIHFVLVCAAKSCPRLRRKALTSQNLEAVLDAAAKEFIPRATRVQEGRAITSQLFNWFKGDFENEAGSVEAYLARYLDGPTAKALRAGELKVEFAEYDWSINKQ